MKSIKGIIGSPARGGQYYPREEAVEEILEAVRAGNNLLVSAPRRVGKTSIMMHLLDSAVTDCYFVYVDTEAVTSSGHFFERLHSAILDSDRIEAFGKFSAKALEFLKKAAGTIGKVGPVEIKEITPIDYYQSLRNFFRKAELDGKRIVVMVDEFPVTIENILEKEGEEAARNFLQLNRSLRLDAGINQRVKFIYTGSISLFHTVSKFKATTDINDLMEVKVRPLLRDQARDFTRRLLSNYSLKINEDALGHFLDRVEWWTPFNIQVSVREVKDLCRERKSEVSIALVDEAFRRIPEHIHIYFQSYESRLSKVLDEDAYKFAVKFLSRLSLDKKTSKSKRFDLAVKYGIEDRLKDVLAQLKYDGYINNNGSREVYRFNSPILKIWWKEYVAD